MTIKYETGIVCDMRYMEHVTGNGHPENPERLKAIYDKLKENDLSDKYVVIDPRPAEKKEILYAHSPEYYQKIAETEGKEITQLTPDTLASEGSFKAALLAVGGLFEAIFKVVAGELKNAFVLARPPGHHAERSRAWVFACLTMWH